MPGVVADQLDEIWPRQNVEELPLGRSRFEYDVVALDNVDGCGRRGSPLQGGAY